MLPGQLERRAHFRLTGPPEADQARWFESIERGSPVRSHTRSRFYVLLDVVLIGLAILIWLHE